MENKMFVFDNPNDFLNFMDYLQKEYNKAHGKGNKEKNNIIVSGGVNK